METLGDQRMRRHPRVEERLRERVAVRPFIQVSQYHCYVPQPPLTISGLLHLETRDLSPDKVSTCARRHASISH